MNWDAIGAVSEGLGSLAVFLTLVYLAVQIRQSERGAQRDVQRMSMDLIQAPLVALATSPWLAEAQVKARRSLGLPVRGQFLVQDAGLSEAEALALSTYFQAVWTHHQASFRYLDTYPAQEPGLARIVGQVYSDPLRARWYEASRAFLDPAMVRWVDGILARRCATEQ